MAGGDRSRIELSVCETRSAVEAAVAILKRRFNNLTAEETLGLAFDIVEMAITNVNVHRE